MNQPYKFTQTGSKQRIGTCVFTNIVYIGMVFVCVCVCSCVRACGPVHKGICNYYICLLFPSHIHEQGQIARTDLCATYFMCLNNSRIMLLGPF